MALKRAVVTQQLGTGTGPWDSAWAEANAGFDSDVKAAIFSNIYSSTVNTSTSNSSFSTGMLARVGGTTTYAHNSIYFLDGVSNPPTATMTAKGTHDTTYVLKHAYIGGWDFSHKSWDTNGFTLTNATTQATNRYATALMLGGDIEANIVLFKFVAQSSFTVSHGLGGAPEVMICLTNNPGTIPDSYCISGIGFWAGGNHACSVMSYTASDGADPAAGAKGTGRITSSYIAMNISSTTGDLNRGFSVSNVGATTFDVTCTQSNSDDLVFLVMRGTTAPLVAKAGVYTTRTSTGTEDMGISLSAPPKVLLASMTRMTALDTSYATDAAGMNGLLMSADRSSSSVTQSGGAIWVADIGATTTDTHSHARNDAALMILSPPGAGDGKATVNTWKSADIELNYSEAAGGAYKIPYLAFGVSESTGGVMHRGFQEMSGNFRG